MASLRKSLWDFLVPGGLIVLAALGLLRPQGLPPWVQGPVHTFPFVVLAFGLFFGWYLSSSRLILSLIVLSGADRGLALLPPADQGVESAHHVMFSALALLLPLNLMALSIMKEEAMSSWRGALWLPLVLIQPVLVLWSAQPGQAWIAHSLQQPLLPGLSTSWTALPQLALLAFAGAVLLIGIRFALNRNPFDSAIFWSVIASFVAVQGFHHGWIPTNFFSAAGLTLFVALLLASHQETYRDELTGIPGKLAYDQTVAGLGSKYVLAVVGIDQLKQYGNRHGKSVSEQMLRLIAPKIMASAGGGKVHRLAGEEFTVLFPRKSTTATLVDLEAMRKAVEEAEFYLRGRHRVWERGATARTKARDVALSATVSIGVAESGDARPALALVTKAAYRALYEAKGEGGNRVKRGIVSADVPKASPDPTGRIVTYSEFES
ncbi:MAG TPA: GGDEF domain-containing protein [Nitrospira sp.]|nr:GGDEF domain-containing protein [Nitrospira sp.]